MGILLQQSKDQCSSYVLVLYVQTFICAICVKHGCYSGLCCCVVVEWVHRWACLFCCAGFLPLSISQGLRGTQGVASGPCKAELVTPIVPQQAHPFSILLSLHCQPTPQHGSRHGNKPDVPLHVNGIRSLTLRAGGRRAGAHVATRAKWTFLHSFLSKALC